MKLYLISLIIAATVTVHIAGTGAANDVAEIRAGFGLTSHR